MKRKRTDLKTSEHKHPSIDMSGSRRRPRNEPPCSHSIYFNGLCGDCGARLDPPQSTSVSMIHSVPELKVSQELARKIGKDDQLKLIQERKLVLLVDLDQTLLHTTHERVKSDPNVISFSLWPGHPTYYTKLRPHLDQFLEEMSDIYQLHIFTFGCRKYAHKIASLIDPNQKYFGNRILSRDESVDQYCKRGNLNNLFPCGDAMVCIIDDRSDVWQNAGNLIQVKPYSYFKSSISDGAATRASVEDEDDESMDRDVDQLEALLGLSDKDEVDDVEEVDDNKKQEQGTSSSQGDNCEETAQKLSSSEPEQSTSSGAKEVRFAEERGESKKKNEEVSSDREGSESPIEDDDDHLLQLTKILKRIYEKWYMELDRETEFLTPEEEGNIAYKLPDIKDIIAKYLRKKF